VPEWERSRENFIVSRSRLRFSHPSVPLPGSGRGNIRVARGTVSTKI